MNEMILRRAEPAELEVLAQIEAICFPQAEAAGLETIRCRLSVFGQWFFVAEMPDGTLAGMINGMATDEASIDDAMFSDASLHRENGRVQTVFGLDVLPAYRGRGIAGRLMDAFVDAARKAEREKVTLTCKQRLIPLYAHMGFVLRGVSRSVHGGAVWYDMDRML